MGKGLGDRNLFETLDVASDDSDGGATFSELIAKDGQGQLDDNP